MSNISKIFDFKNLVDYSKCKGITSINFIEFRSPMHISHNIKSGNTSIKKTRKRSKTISIKSK